MIFNVLSVLLAGAVGYVCLRYFAGSARFVLFAVIGGAFLTANFLDFLFTRDPRRGMVVGFLQILAFLAFFYTVKLSVLLSAFAILAIFYFLAHRAAAAASENSLKFKTGPLARPYMKKIFVGFALAAIVLYLPQWNSGNVFVPQPRFQKWYDGFAATSQRFNVGIDLTASVGGFADSLVRAQLATNDQFRKLPPAQQEQAVQKGIQEFIGNMSKNLGFALSPAMPLSEAFYLYLSDLFADLRNQFGDSFFAAWAVALFVIVWSVGTLLIWLVVIAAYLIFELLAAMNVIHIAGETRTKEIVELS